MRTNTEALPGLWRVLVYREGEWTEDARGTHEACWDRYQELAAGGEHLGDVALLLQAPREGAWSDGR